MVNQFESEHPNLSFVHVNQATSAGSEEFKRGYITNGLQRTDLMVVNAELLHKSLTAPAPPEPVVVTAYWDSDLGALEAIVDKTLKVKNGSNQVSSQRPLDSTTFGRTTDDAMDVSPAASSEVGDPTFGPGHLTSGAGNLAAGGGNSTSEAGELVSGVGNPASEAGELVSGVGNPASGAGDLVSGVRNLASGAGDLVSYVGNPASGAGSLTSGASVSSAPAGAASKYKVVVADNSAPAVSVPGKSSASTGRTPNSIAPSFTIAVSAPARTTSVKRPLVDCQAVESQKTPRIVEPKFVVQTNQAQLLQENRRLESENANLREKNMELQEKLDLLGTILRDPRKRELLHARLQMHPAIAKN